MKWLNWWKTFTYTLNAWNSLIKDKMVLCMSNYITLATRDLGSAAQT
jgi:hypothetical protein